jgi:hypothetical protein
MLADQQEIERRDEMRAIENVVRAAKQVSRLPAMKRSADG